jgi:MraZ protein
MHLCAVSRRQILVDDWRWEFMLWGRMESRGDLWTKMLLTGTYERTLDDKLRLAMPKPLRESLADEKQLILTPGTDGSLSLFPQSAFAGLAEQLAARSPSGQEVRAFSRLLYAQSHTVELDSQGRLRLPAELAKLANLDGDVVLLGVGDRVELWNKTRWDAYLTELQPRYDELAESALSQPTSSDSSSTVQPEARPMQPR